MLQNAIYYANGASAGMTQTLWTCARVVKDKQTRHCGRGLVFALRTRLGWHDVTAGSTCIRRPSCRPEKVFELCKAVTAHSCLQPFFTWVLLFLNKQCSER